MTLYKSELVNLMVAVQEHAGYDQNVEAAEMAAGAILHNPSFITMKQVIWMMLENCIKRS